MELLNLDLAPTVWHGNDVKESAKSTKKKRVGAKMRATGKMRRNGKFSIGKKIMRADV